MPEFRHSYFYRFRRVVSHCDMRRNGNRTANTLRSLQKTNTTPPMAHGTAAQTAQATIMDTTGIIPRASIKTMDHPASLVQRMPHTMAFPNALGTGLLISTARPVPAELRGEMERCIDGYEQVLSRFRADSLVTRIGSAEHGGHFDFPDWTGPLFDLYDALHSATSGAIDPCVGEDLIRLGYDPALSFTVEADAGEHLGALRGRAVWGRDVVRAGGTALVTQGPVHLDFGACGKGYLVDVLGGLLADEREFVIDAGGDLLVHATEPISVALEDPEDPSRAVGVAHIADGAFCASAPSRRHWEVAVDERTHLAIHHLLNAVDGLPAQQVEATWTSVRADTNANVHSADESLHHMAVLADFPTALADGLATALFVADPDELSRVFAFGCAMLDAGRHARISAGFPGRFF